MTVMFDQIKVGGAAILLLSSLLGSAGYAAPVYVYDDGLGTWSDVNKTNVSGPPDSLFCWACAASNTLAWTGWWGWDSGTSSYIDDAGEIYDVFLDNWSNRTGAATFAYEWWMTDRTESIIEDPPGTSVFTFDSAGLNFYPGVNVQEGPGSVTAFVPVAFVTESVLSDYVTQDRGIVLTVEIPLAVGGGTYLHSLTLWGIDEVANEIYLTDSDDGVTGLRTFDIFETGSGLFIDDYTNLYTSATDAQILQVTRLNRNDPFIEPRRNGIPEPASIFLVALGVLAAGYRRSR